MMAATNIEHIRSNGVNDIFKFINDKGEEDLIKFPRTMEMRVDDVSEWLND